MEKMKTIGLIGGMSWQSTSHYYNLINEGVYNRLGGLNSAEMLLYSVNFKRFAELQSKGDWKPIASELTSIARRLEGAGAEFIIICTNTMHIAADRVQAGIGIPLLHIVDPTASEIKKSSISKVGLLGTKPTMEEEFYKGRLRKMHGIDVVIPEEADRDLVHRIIFDELCLGKTSDASRATLQNVIYKLEWKGAEGVILGCTELNMLIRKTDDFGIRVFDTTELHAKAAVDMALGSQA
jgi:aspartate racemase